MLVFVEHVNVSVSVSCRVTTSRVARLCVEAVRLHSAAAVTVRRTLPRVTFIPARWFTETPGRRIDVVVWHDTETAELPSSAESVARYFQTTDRKASAHSVCDVDSTIECVFAKDIAYHAPGANHNGYGVELCGRAAQTGAQWLDAYSRRMLVEQAAPVGAALTAFFDLPVHWLTPAELRAGMRGHTSHWNVSLAFRKSSHTDPGVNFPASFLLDEIRSIIGGPMPSPQPGFDDAGPFVWVHRGSPEESFWRSYIAVSKLAQTHRVAAVDPAVPPPTSGAPSSVNYTSIPRWPNPRLGANRVETLERMLADAFGAAVNL